MKLPATRYYGSKRRVVEKIWAALQENHIDFDSMLDLFGGTGIVSYYMAKKGKAVLYNDILSFNCEIATALLQSPKGVFTETCALNLLQRVPGRVYQTIIEDNFEDIYYPREENRLIDTVIQNISFLNDDERASAYYVLFQSCMITRPFNIFHRRNLNLRTSFIKANFGNKTTWEQSFESLFVKFTQELNEFQFAVLPRVEVSNMSALHCDREADLVYIDTPYFREKQSAAITYHNRYHFLEGLMHYEDIPEQINNEKVNREIKFGKNHEFEQRSHYVEDLNDLLSHHQNSTIALSYTSAGFPSIDELCEIIGQYKEQIIVCNLGNHPFALNHNNEDRNEVLIIGK